MEAQGTIYNNLLKPAYEASKPLYNNFVDYAKPLKLPVEQISAKIHEHIQDPYFYGYLALGVCAWYHTTPFVAAAITGMCLAGGWGQIQDTYPDLLPVASWLPLPFRKEGSEKVNSYFDNTVESIRSQDSIDSKIIAVAACLFLAWFSTYVAIASGVMLGNHIWHRMNDPMRPYSEEQQPHIKQIAGNPAADNYYLLAQTLTKSSSVVLLDERKMTMQALLVEAIKLDTGKGEYYTALAATMKTDATIHIDTKDWTYKDLLQQASSLVV